MFQLKSKILQAELFFTWKVKLYCSGPERIRAVGRFTKHNRKGEKRSVSAEKIVSVLSVLDDFMVREAKPQL